MSTLLQVIDRDMNFCTDLRSTTTQAEFEQCGDRYYVIAVLGCQSTGKSTLLNRLFGTQFVTMDSTKGRQQTTLGVWMGLTTGNTEEQKLLVFDVEGTDSKERGEDHGVFERKTSLFSLALSEVLMINLWTNDVGRFEGSNYGLLKTVFDLNLQLFAKEKGPKTLLLFVLRDHDPEETSLEKLSATLMEDVDRLWQDIKKPENFVTSSVNDFFDFEFVSLPHYKFKKQAWEQQALELRDRFFNPSNPKYLLKDSYKTNIPADGFSTYAHSVWSTIQSEKDLDLPSQRHMLAIFRCDEITEEAIALISPIIASITQTLSESAITENFGSTVRSATSSALSHFDYKTNRYDPEVVSQKRAVLNERISALFKPLFQGQLQLILTASKKFLLERLDTEFGIPNKKKKPRMDFKALEVALTEQVTSFFNTRAESSSISQDSSGKEWKPESEDLKMEIKRELKNARDIQLHLYVENEKIHISHLYSASLAELLDETDNSSLWTKSAYIYERDKQTVRGSAEATLTEFGCTVDEIESYLTTFDKICFTTVHTIFEERASDIALSLPSTFKKSFLIDESGVPRRWGKTDENEVTKLYKQSLEKTEALLDLYCIMRLDPSFAKASYFTRNSEGSLESSKNHVDEKDPDVAKYILVSSRDANKMLENLREQAKLLRVAAAEDVEKAKQSGQIPYYVIIICMILGANEIWWLLTTSLTNPFFLLLLLVIGAGSYIVWKLHLWPAIAAATVPLLKEVQTYVQYRLASNGAGVGGKKKGE